MYCQGVKVPTDTSSHIVRCSCDTAEWWAHCLRHAIAFAELFTRRNLQLPPGGVETDGANVNVMRDQPKSNTHCGRFVVVYHKDTGAYALEPCPDKTVKKGAAPPPETIEEVEKACGSKLKKDWHFLGSDSGSGIKGFMRQKSLGIPHATVVHKNKQFTTVRHIPLKDLKGP